MALNQIIRRTFFSISPLAVRAAASTLPFPTAVRVATSALSRGIGRCGSVSIPHFSTAVAEKEKADKNLIQVLQDEIAAAEDEPKDVEEFPEDFPFEIKDTPGERTVTLTRSYQDETIKVEVDVPTYDKSDDEGDDENSSAASCIPLVVTVTKGGGQCLEFGVSAFPDEVSIDSLSVRAPGVSEDELAYEGPDFGDLDENLQKAFHKYIEIRGIKPSTTNFLFDYMQKKDNKEYFKWLHNLRSFMEK